MEILIQKASQEAQDKLANEPLCVINDSVQHLSGFTISYLEFSQGMIASKTLLRDIYEPIFTSSRSLQNFEQLKEIANEQASSALLTSTQVKRTKGKRKTNKWDKENIHVFKSTQSLIWSVKEKQSEVVVFEFKTYLISPLFL